MISLFTRLFPNHNFKWDKKGRNAMALCPFHTDRNASFTIYVDSKGKERWYCFVDQFGGTEVDAVMKAKDVTYELANEWLIKAGLLQESELDLKRRTLHEALNKFLIYSKDLLLNSPSAKAIRIYLASRGISNEVLANAPIGFYPNDEIVEVWMEENGIPPELYDEFIPKATASKNIARGAIVFFYRSARDRWSKLKLRNPIMEEAEESDPEAPNKRMIYLGRKEAKLNGFFCGSMDLPKAEHGLAIEGEVDVLALLSLCERTNPGVSEPIYCFGSGGNIQHGIQILNDMGIENAYTFPDNDPGGLIFASNVAEAFPHTFIVFPDDYESGADPADWSRSHSFEDLQRAYRNRVPAFEWIGKQLASEYATGTVEDQSHLKDKLIKYARKLSPSNREIFLKTYAPLTGVSYESLWEEVQTLNKIAYRKVYDPSQYGIHMGVEKKGVTTYEQISNIILEIEKDVIIDTGETSEYCSKDLIDNLCNNDPEGSSSSIKASLEEVIPSSVEGEEGNERLIVIRASTVNREFRIRMASREFADEKRFYEKLITIIGSDAWIKPRHVQFVRDSAQLLPGSAIKKEDVVFAHTGWRDGKYLYPNGYIDVEGFHSLGDIKVELPNSSPMFKSYKLAPPPGDIKPTLKLIADEALQVFSYDITLPIIAHFFLPPVFRMVPQINPYMLWIQGLTGSYKTSYTAALQCLYGNFTRRTTETWKSTSNALERNGFYLKDCMYVIDDYKRSVVTDKSLTSLVQTYGDGNSKSRMTSNAGHQRNWPIRGLVTSTGEDIPN